MRSLILLAIVGCALAQRAQDRDRDGRYNDGRYYPELYQGKYNDGKYRPDGSGAYRPDDSGKYSGKYVPYVDGKYGVGGQGGAGGAGGAGSGFGGRGGAGGSGSGGSFGSGAKVSSSASTGASSGVSSGASFGASSGAAIKGSGVGNRRVTASSNSGKVSVSTSVPAVPPKAPAQKAKTPSFSSASSGSGSGFDRIKEQVKQYNNDGYYYRYLTEQDAQVAEAGRIEDRDTESETLRAKGFFEYVGDDGVRYRVDYNADENGFVPRGAHLPTPPPIPEAILKALEYVRSLQQ